MMNLPFVHSYDRDAGDVNIAMRRLVQEQRIRVPRNGKTIA
jgi:hypothetical protein